MGPARRRGRQLSPDDPHHEPHAPGDRDARAREEDLPALDPLLLPQDEHQREEDRHHEELAGLDAEVERDEGEGDLRTRERDLAERAREAKSVHEAERERDAPALLGARDEEVLEADIGDRQRDGRLDDARRRGPYAEGGEGEGDRGCARVKAVTTPTSARTRPPTRMRPKRKTKWSYPVRMCSTPASPRNARNPRREPARGRRVGRGELEGVPRTERVAWPR